MSDDEKLQKACYKVVVKLMTKHNWCLLSQEEYVRLVLARAAPVDTQPAPDIGKIALNEYAKTLYDACHLTMKEENSLRHSQAYEELGRYLYNIARAKRPDALQDAEDATQQALERIHQAFSEDEIRRPGAFLAFSMGKLQAALTAIDRQKQIGGKKPRSWEELTSGFQEDDDTADREPQLAGRSPSTTGEVAERQQLMKEIAAELQRKFRIHPRAIKQLQAVLLKYAFGYNNEEIGMTLDIPSMTAVATLIFRGKEKLKNNEELAALYAHCFSLETQSHLH